MINVRYPFGEPPSNVEVWWRAVDRCYSVVIDSEREIYGVDGPFVEVFWLAVTKHTPKGVWLSVGGWCYPRFVLREARKRYASPTIEGALESFIARKRRQARIYKTRLDRADAAARIGEEALKTGALEEVGSE